MTNNDETHNNLPLEIRQMNPEYMPQMRAWSLNAQKYKKNVLLYVMSFSIVIPVFNEEAIIPELFRRTVRALETVTGDFEIIAVNDGSEDRSLEALLECHRLDKRFKVLDLSRNFGHQEAVLAGMTFASGELVGIMDGDLQDPPESFPVFYQKLQTGYDVVYAVRRQRKESWYKKAAYWLYYRILYGIAEMKIPLDSGDFCLMRRHVTEAILKMPESSLFIRGLRFWVGFRQAGVEYDRDERQAGDTKYDLRRLLRLGYNGIFSFSDFPIKLLGRIGYFTIAGSAVYAVFLLYKRLFWAEVPEGFTTLILAIFFFGGVQLVSMRILGEYVGRIYKETRKRPLFIVREYYDS